MAFRNGTVVVIVGGGGIGSAVLQDLARFLPDRIPIIVMDGDVVEGKNLQRQMFSRKHLGRNKAECLAELATGAIGLERVYYKPEYLKKPEQLHEMTKEFATIVLIGAVDNHPARRVMEKFVASFSGSGEKARVYYVDCANEVNRGEVVAVLATPEGLFGSFRSTFDPSVLTDNSADPTQVSCTHMLDDGNMQVLYTNRKAAIIAVELTHRFLATKEAETGVIYFRDCCITRTRVEAPA